MVNLREKLRWFDNRPLFGKRVLVTRTRDQASALSDLLREHGAEPVEFPVIRISPPDSFDDLDAAERPLIEDLTEYDAAEAEQAREAAEADTIKRGFGTRAPRRLRPAQQENLFEPSPQGRLKL